MKKKVLGIVAALSLVTSLGFAAPMNDFSQGKVAVDISARPSGDIEVSDNGGSTTYDGKTSWEYGVTVGLGNNFAFGYKNLDSKSKDYNFISPNDNGKVKTNEFNILYKANENFTVFTGVNTVKSVYEVAGIELEGDSNTNWQVGVTGQAPIGERLTGYATVAAGKDSNAWKIGASYAIDKTLDFNLFYAANKYKNVKYNDIISNLYVDDKADYTIKGMGYGITYKF